MFAGASYWFTEQTIMVHWRMGSLMAPSKTSIPTTMNCCQEGFSIVYVDMMKASRLWMFHCEASQPTKYTPSCLYQTFGTNHRSLSKDSVGMDFSFPGTSSEENTENTQNDVLMLEVSQRHCQRYQCHSGVA